MATKVYSAFDFQHIPIQGFAFESLASAPSSPSPGWAYYDSSVGCVRVYLGSGSWFNVTNLDVTTIADGSIALAKLATDPLARANHTGTQTASTVSDLATVVQAYPLDQFAQPTSALNVGGQRATNAADPTGSTDLTTMQWVQSAINAKVNGLDWKTSARVVATANVNIASAPATIDSVTLTTGDRVLLTGQTTASQNGIYDYAGSGSAMTRSADADASAEVTGNLALFVSEGTTYADTAWQLTTNDAITLGTTALTFAQFGSGTSYTAQTPISLVGTQFQLGTVTVAKGGTGATTAAAARTALGVAQQGFASDVGALTAGVGLAIAHGLGTDDLVVMVRNKSTGAMVLMDTVVDATNITLTSAVAASSGTYRVTAVPVA